VRSVWLYCIEFTYLYVVLIMFIKEKPLSAPALLVEKVVTIVTETLKPGCCPTSTACSNANKYLLTFKKEYNFTLESFQTNISKAERLEQRLVRADIELRFIIVDLRCMNVYDRTEISFDRFLEKSMKAIFKQQRNFT